METRRRLITAAAVLGVAPLAGAWAPPLPADRRYDRDGHAPLLAVDADLIAICDQHVRNISALNSASDIEDEDPRWDAYHATADAISAARPMTLEGMAAKAKVVKVEATEPDGTENLEEMSLDWAWDLINDLLRIGGRAGE